MFMGCCLQAVTVQAVSVTTGKQYLFIVGPAGLCFAAGQTAFAFAAPEYRRDIGRESCGIFS